MESEALMTGRVYRMVVEALRAGLLPEPFGQSDFQHACTGLGKGTYKAFLHKHAKGNPGNNSELFVRVRRGKFKCIRPYKYGL